MRFWHRLSRKHKRNSIEGQLVLGNAYRAVFYGNPDRQQQQMVLADLAARCGWGQTKLPQYASSRELWFSEGKRSAYGEIHAFLSLTHEDILALDNAVRHEAATNDQDA